MKIKCIKDVIIEGKVYFTNGKYYKYKYNSKNNDRGAFINDLGEIHFISKEFFPKHFIQINLDKEKLNYFFADEGCDAK